MSGRPRQTSAAPFPLLPPGVYELNVEAEGLQNPRRRIVVQTSATTRVEIELVLDVLEQVVEALDKLSELRYDWHGIDGVVSRFQIENLPLNGREFLQLSILEPGVTAARPLSCRLPRKPGCGPPIQVSTVSGGNCFGQREFQVHRPFQNGAIGI